MSAENQNNQTGNETNTGSNAGNINFPGLDPVIKGVQIEEADTDYISIKLLRPEDLLSLELRFKNFSLQEVQRGFIKQKVLVKNSNTDPGLMMAIFEPQSIFEECGREEVQAKIPPALPARMLCSTNSRLVFKIKKKELSLDVNELLDWEYLELVVNSRAKNVSVFKGNSGSFSITGISEQAKGISITEDLESVSDFEIPNTRALTKDAKLNLKQDIFQLDETQQDLNLTDDIITDTTNNPEVAMDPPGEWETSIELPCLLFISPLSYARWKHTIPLRNTKGVISSKVNVYELWHTRMGVPVGPKYHTKIDDSDLTAEERQFRVLWGFGVGRTYDHPPVQIEVNASMNSFKRHCLVHETSNFSIQNFIPQPVHAHKLFLTSLGGYLDSIFNINEDTLPAPLILTKWRHIQTLAREQYVEIVNAGYIMPFGHKASIIEITERKPHPQTLTATNFKRTIAVITQPVKHYNYRDSNNNFMSFCFSKVELLTTSTPLLSQSAKLPGTNAFVMRSDNADILFKIHAEDLNGNIVNFQMPLVFVDKASLSNELITAYNAQFHPVNFNGQKVSLAPKENGSCDTAYPAYTSGFKVMDVSDSKFDNADEQQGFLPMLDETEIAEPSYQRLTGNERKFSVLIVDDSNDVTIFACLKSPCPVDFKGNADKTGGFAVPNFSITGLSKTAGATGGTIVLAGDPNDAGSPKKVSTFDSSPAAYFQVPKSLGLNPLLFGVFKLNDILDFGGNQIPKLATTETKDEVITSYNLEAALHSFPATLTGADFIQFITQDQTISITTTVTTKKTNDYPLPAPQLFTTAVMGPFDIGLMNLMSLKMDGFLLTVGFENIKFTASPGKSADISINLKSPAITFGGPLSFINAFQQLIPGDGFSDPPYLDVSTTGVKCGYTLAIPNVQLGAFTLANLSLSADVNLPFTGAPMVLGFRFCEKQQPFTLTVSLLGGGGYFGFEVDLHGLRQIDAALEFGAAAALNLGVASGAVSIMAGIYFKMTTVESENSTELTGYLRINGAMSIIGLITAAIELYMAFTYLITTNKVYGEAEVSIKVHVVFFSKTVCVHTSRTFSGSGNDPNFGDTYSADSWQKYCDAFAA